MKPGRTAAPLKNLVVDVGGSHVKFLASGQSLRREFVSGPRLAPRQMVQRVLEMTADWAFDAVTIGYPGVVRHGVRVREPHNLGDG